MWPRYEKSTRLCCGGLFILRFYSAVASTTKPTPVKRFPGLQWVPHLLEHMKKMGLREGVVWSCAAFEHLWEGALALLREGGAQDRLVFAHREKVRLFTPVTVTVTVTVTGME